jgi:hypothetical protein
MDLDVRPVCDKSDATESAKGGSRVKNLAEKIAAMRAKAELTKASSVPRAAPGAGTKLLEPAAASSAMVMQSLSPVGKPHHRIA